MWKSRSGRGYGESSCNRGCLLLLVLAHGREAGLQDTLKGLLAEHLLEQQRITMAEMMAGRREMQPGDENHDGGQGAEGRSRACSMASGRWSSAWLSLRDTIRKECPSPCSTETVEPSGTERHKFTLVFGLWPRDTARKSILDQVHSALRELQVSQCTAFCAGPRKSMCLLVSGTMKTMS